MARTVVLGLALLFVGLTVAGGLATPAAAVGPSDFIFSFAGDFGSWGGFDESLGQLGRTGSDFAIALGDLSYGGKPEAEWCAEFRDSFRNVLILAGNHETGLAGEVGGDINEFLQHCPYPLDVPLIGVYGKQYYFDFPQERPLARFVLLSPALTFIVDDNETYDYSVDTPRYNWARRAIDTARAIGIPWVIVGSHKVCIGAGEHGCEIGTDLFNLLLDRKVDLIIQAHNHHYGRSHQLALSDACPGIAEHAFEAGCVVDDGSDRDYTRGAGSVVVIAGTGGRDLIPFDTSNPHADYFAAWAQDPAALGKGVVSFRVSSDRITYQTYFSGTYSDGFTLATPPPQAPFLQVMIRAVPVLAPAAVGIELIVIATVVWQLSKRTRMARQATRIARGPGRPAAHSANGGRPDRNGAVLGRPRGRRTEL